MPGLPPHVTGEDFLKLYDIEPGSPQAYALTSEDFAALAKTYGRMGGLDRIATILKRIRAERGDNVLLLDGGDTWQGSYTSLQTKGQDMVEAMNALKPDAMTGHWEFTYGAERVKETHRRPAVPVPRLQHLRHRMGRAGLRRLQDLRDAAASRSRVIGQAFPYTPIANPRWMIPNWSFGIREEDIAANVEEARAEGADLVVLLSHNGFDVDRKLAARVSAASTSS